MDDDQVRADTMTLKLRALHGGAYTKLSLDGPMATVPQGAQLRRLFGLLAFWSGAPVDVVLCVSIDTSGWLEIWSDALAAVPARDARIRYLINRDTLTGGAGPDGDR